MQRRPGESREMAFCRLIEKDDDCRESYRASKIATQSAHARQTVALTANMGSDALTHQTASELAIGKANALRETSPGLDFGLAMETVLKRDPVLHKAVGAELAQQKIAKLSSTFSLDAVSRKDLPPETPAYDARNRLIRLAQNYQRVTGCDDVMAWTTILRANPELADMLPSDMKLENITPTEFAPAHTIGRQTNDTRTQSQRQADDVGKTEFFRKTDTNLSSAAYLRRGRTKKKTDELDTTSEAFRHFAWTGQRLRG
jgi:hypothetical protein